MPHDNLLVRAAISLRPDQDQAIRRISRESGAPISELVRRSLDLFLELTQRRGETGTPQVDTLLR